MLFFNSKGGKQVQVSCRPLDPILVPSSCYKGQQSLARKCVTDKREVQCLLTPNQNRIKNLTLPDHLRNSSFSRYESFDRNRTVHTNFTLREFVQNFLSERCQKKNDLESVSRVFFFVLIIYRELGLYVTVLTNCFEKKRVWQDGERHGETSLSLSLSGWENN